jgi:hypothetical protein
MRWDWMILPGSHPGSQVMIDLVAPALIVLLFRVGRFHGDDRIAEPTAGEKRFWWCVVAGLYLWFFSATIWHYFIGPTRQVRGGSYATAQSAQARSSRRITNRFISQRIQGTEYVVPLWLRRL